MSDDSKQAVVVVEIGEDSEDLPAPVPAQTEEQAHDDALLAKLEVCPRPNKLNFAFGQFLLARKFHDAAIRAELEERALQILLKAAVAIASERNWVHPEGITENERTGGRTCKSEWKSEAWSCLSVKAQKFSHLTEDEILEHIQGRAKDGQPKFWAWRWMFEHMITLFRHTKTEHKRQVEYHFAARSDRRRGGNFSESDEDNTYGQWRTENPDEKQHSNGPAIDRSPYDSELAQFDPAVNPVPSDRLITDAELRFDHAEGGYEDDLSPEPGSQSSQRLPNPKKRDLLRHVDPDLLVFLDRLTRDANFRAYMLGSDLEEPGPGMEQGKPKLAKDFDRELPKLAALVLERYAKTHGLSLRTAQRRMEAVRELRDKDKQFLSRFGSERR
jgi:hypothetical protein